MRDPKRISKIVVKLMNIWMSCPDQRFYQLLINKGLIPDSEQWSIKDKALEKTLDKIIKKEKIPDYFLILRSDIQ